MNDTQRSELAPHLRTGKRGEELAAQYLEKKGWAVESRNFDAEVGEIDIVAIRPVEGGTLVAMVEVKSRKAGSRSRAPLSLSVTASKRRKVIRAARVYADRYGSSKRSYRFDVITVDFNGDPPTIEHFEGAFDASGKPY